MESIPEIIEYITICIIIYLNKIKKGKNNHGKKIKRINKKKKKILLCWY